MDGKAAEEAEAEEAFGMSATPNAPDFLKHSATRVVQKSSPGAERLRERHKGHFSNSTNSLFIADTPTAPNHKLLLRAAAQAVLALVQEDKSAEHSLFDERAHPLSSDKLGVLPSADDVYTFMKNLYTRTRMQAECVVITLCYIERLLRASQALRLTQYSWRRIVLSAMVVADKCYEDYAVWNADFVSMFDRSDIHDMNALERAFLVAIDFSTRCSASDYMKYYFALRELSADALPQKPLSEAATRQLEHNTEKFQNAQKKKNANGGAFLRSVSLHHFTPDGNGAAPSESSDN